MNIEDEIDKILERYEEHILLMHRDAPKTSEGQSSYRKRGREEAKARLIVLVDHGGLETSSDPAPVGGNQAANLSAKSAGE